AYFYNVMREFGRQAEIAGIEPPFKFIAPSPPEEPEFVNSDGSLDYQGLRDSGFLEWLEQGTASQPGVFDWIEDNIVDPLADGIATAIDYSVAGWDNAIDWAANGVDDIWEVVQEGLQEFVLILSDPSEVQVRIRIL